ncbi:MAG: hypothetical protein Q8Q88_24125 [Phenylobacterium sp.]|uniref:hypothetical protein n=1 Tax=Phenylobacterium sp. TaxID=1871053 RepID=UPI0027353956|nr:hypothetical protein [Phenylobacterium sp.]MDP3750125.1 hypothetical protein [Phenylobacterium sp.]
MSTVRPPIFPQAQAPNQGVQPSRNPGQRAFFEAALGKTAPQTQAVAAAPAAPTHKIPTSLPADPPEKILRPGSLLDIRV